MKRVDPARRAVGSVSRPIVWIVVVGWILLAAATPRAWAGDLAGGWGEIPVAENPLAGFGHGLPDAMRAGHAPGGRLVDYGPYDAAVETPEAALGFPLGARPAWHQEIVKYSRYLAEASAHARWLPYGATHEGRPLFVLMISSAARVADPEAVQRALARWADPRLERTADEPLPPLCVWVGACVHGNEPSGADAALELAYALVASHAPEVERLRDSLVVLIDPLQNPDGHDRILAQWRGLAGRQPDADDQSLRQWGLWPGGRTNHYLFDLNRDWFYNTQPESQGRTRLITSWHPQVMIDAHEMGGQDTYLFSPPREPFHPAVGAFHHTWWERFARDHAAAFDQRRWDYYVGSWHEEWFPGFASAWSAGIGAIGILYEQASARGSRVARRDGTLMTYRDTVEQQFVSYMTNLATAVRHRGDILAGFREQVAGSLREAAGAFVFDAGEQPDRAAALAAALENQGVELFVTTEEGIVREAAPYWSDGTVQVRLAPGALIVPLRQPHAALVEAVLGFDPPMEEAFLRSQRRELEKEGQSRIYDVTGWTFSLASGLPAYRTRTVPRIAMRPLEEAPAMAGAVVQPGAGLGFLVDGADDRCLWALGRLWERGLRVHAAREPFTVEGRSYSRGSLLIKRAAQVAARASQASEALQGIPGTPADAAEPLEGILEEIARETAVTFRGVGTGLTSEGPDFGDRAFRALVKPRIAVVAGGGVSWSDYGAMAWVLDIRAGLAFTPLSVDDVGEVSLARYNVLVAPDFWKGADGLGRALGPAGEGKLRAWVQAGGTLIACGAAAAYAADSSKALGTVRLRRDVLESIARRTALALERGEAEGLGGRLQRAPSAGTLTDGEFALTDLAWAKEPGLMDGRLPGGHAGLLRPEPLWPWAVGRGSEELAAEDARMRLFHPRGCILRVQLDPESWLTTGCGIGPANRREVPSPEWMPVQVRGDRALVATRPEVVMGAFATEDSLRLSGLLWPEGRQRWAQTAYLTRERVGDGQVILFAATPCSRGVWKSAERAFLNAVILGPSMGAEHPEPY